MKDGEKVVEIAKEFNKVAENAGMTELFKSLTKAAIDVLKVKETRDKVKKLDVRSVYSVFREGEDSEYSGELPDDLSIGAESFDMFISQATRKLVTDVETEGDGSDSTSMGIENSNIDIPIRLDVLKRGSKYLVVLGILAVTVVAIVQFLLFRPLGGNPNLLNGSTSLQFYSLAKLELSPTLEPLLSPIYQYPWDPTQQVIGSNTSSQ